MAKNKELYDKIKEILIKKAEGYFYSEESFEYVLKPEKEEQLCFDDVLNKNGKKTNSQEPLNLVKKKVTSHYIPPDMLAVKILFETLKEKVSENDLDNMSDEELLNLKDKLLGELINEDSKNQ